MKFESIPPAENNEESYRGFLSVIHEKLKDKKWKLAAMAITALAFARFAQVQFEGVKGSDKGVSCFLEGDEEKRVRFVTPESFGEEWSAEKVSIEDSRFERIIFESGDPDQTRNTEISDEALDAYFEESGCPENPTPQEAVSIVKEASRALHADPARIFAALKLGRENLSNVYVRNQVAQGEGKYKISLAKDTNGDTVADEIEIAFDTIFSEEVAESEDPEKLELLQSIGELKQHNLISQEEYDGMYKQVNEQITASEE